VWPVTPNLYNYIYIISLLLFFNQTSASTPLLVDIPASSSHFLCKSRIQS
jgi:hypothetical protein